MRGHRDILCVTFSGRRLLLVGREPSHVAQNHAGYQTHPESQRPRAYSRRETRFGRSARESVCLSNVLKIAEYATELTAANVSYFSNIEKIVRARRDVFAPARIVGCFKVAAS